MCAFKLFPITNQFFQVMAQKKLCPFEAFKGGSRNALHYYTRLDSQKIYHFLLGKTEDRMVAKALTDKVFFVAFTIRKKFRTETQLRSCLFRIGKGLYAEYLQDQASLWSDKTAMVFSPDEDCSVFDDAERAKIEILTEIRSSFRKLSVRRRRILVFYFFRDMKTKEIAEKLGIAKQTALNHKSQALALLKKDLGLKWYEKNNPFCYS
jgi:RNA polymerase sigma factor (sigma-70 family)